MLDHVLGRPDTRFRKYQVFTVVFLWSLYLYKGDRHGPPFFRKLSSFLSAKLTAWQTVVITLLYLYVARNFGRVVGLVSPEPLANLYTRDYFRATWITTALDAGFWSTMNLRPIWFRDIASMVASIYYLFCAEQADEMVRKVLGCVNIDFMRVSWNKARSPYLAFLTDIMRPRFMKTKPRKIIIPRPPWSEYSEPISAWLYFDGPLESLKRHDKVILDIPGGGFVAMDPRCHDDKLLEWAGKSGLPIVALNYKKAPEHPYPYALNECYDAYCELLRTNGRCVGLAGDDRPKIVVSGDSAGGNLAVGMTLMLLQASPSTIFEANYRDERLAIPLPEGLVLIYPALDMNMSNWITPQQIALIRQKRKTNKGVLDRMNEDFRRLKPRTPFGSDLFDQNSSSPPPETGEISQQNGEIRKQVMPNEEGKQAELDSLLSKDVEAPSPKTVSKPVSTKKEFTTSLAMSSMISYFHDRVLSPELMRAMLLLYVGEHNQPDFTSDFLLSPLLAPELLLSRFPKVYMLTGERDPLSDDTVLFAGRLRQAHEQRFLQRQELGLESSKSVFDVTKHVEYMMIPGISHGFLQFVNIYPAGWKYVEQCRHWMMDIFKAADARPTRLSDPTPLTTPLSAVSADGSYFDFSRKATDRRGSEHAIDDGPDSPLEMSSQPKGRSTSALHTSRGRNDRHGIKKSNQIYLSGRRSPSTTKRSLSRLSSSENLIDRRMKGLTMNLMGDGKTSQLP